MKPRNQPHNNSASTNNTHTTHQDSMNQQHQTHTEASDNSQEEETIDTPTPQPRPQRKISLTSKIAMGAVFAALTLPTVFDYFAPQDSPSSPSTSGDMQVIDFSASQKEIRQSLNTLSESANVEEAAILKQFYKDLKIVQKKNNRGALSGMNETSAAIIQRNSITLLFLDQVKDFVDRGHRTQGHMEVYMKPFVTKLKHTVIRTDSLLNKLQRDLEALNNRYAQQAGEIIESKREELPTPYFNSLMTAHDSIPKKISLQVGMATMMVTGEAICLNTTKAALKQCLGVVVKKLGPSVAKAVSSMGIAAADGPLPIGDVIAVGLGAWTVYDLATLPREIRNAVRKELHKVRREHISNLNRETQGYVKKLIQSSRHSRGGIQQCIITHL